MTHSLFLIFLLLFFSLRCTVNPLSKITVTSHVATVSKSPTNPAHMTLAYHDHVQVTLADESRINADHLTIITDKKMLKKTNTRRTSRPEPIRSITLTDHVRFVRDNRSVIADRADIDPAGKTCKLQGHVTIEQVKKNTTDIPLVTHGQELSVDLKTGTFTVHGNAARPVATVIELNRDEKRS